MYTSFVRDQNRRCFLTFRRNQQQALESGRKQVLNLSRPDLYNDVCVEWGYGIGLSDWINLVPDGVRLSSKALNEHRIFCHSVDRKMADMTKRLFKTV